MTKKRQSVTEPKNVEKNSEEDRKRNKSTSVPTEIVNEKSADSTEIPKFNNFVLMEYSKKQLYWGIL